MAASVGCDVGAVVGAVVGATVGPDVTAVVGLAVGSMVGRLVIRVVGPSVAPKGVGAGVGSNLLSTKFKFFLFLPRLSLIMAVLSVRLPLESHTSTKPGRLLSMILYFPLRTPVNKKLPSESVTVVPLNTPFLNVYNEMLTPLRLTSPVPSSFLSSLTFPAMEPCKGHKVGREVKTIVDPGAVGETVGTGVGAVVGPGVSLLVGSGVGLGAGFAVGGRVGYAVGARVGFFG